MNSQLQAKVVAHEGQVERVSEVRRARSNWFLVCKIVVVPMQMSDFEKIAYYVMTGWKLKNSFLGYYFQSFED